MKTALAFIATLSLTAAASAQTTYTIVEISAAGCAAAAVNNYSDVAGQCDGVATLWKNGVAATLGKLPNGTYSIVSSSHAGGVAVGYGDASDGRPRAELFRSGTVADIDPSAANAYAIRITDTGVIAGNALKGFGGCSNWVAAIWTEDPTKPGNFRRTELQPYPGGDGKVRCEFAAAANQNVQVVGWVQNSLFGQMGAFWNNDAKHTLSLLQPFPGDWSSLAWSMNELGQAVGESHPPFGSRPVLWNNDGTHTVVDLPVLAGDNYGVAVGVNNAGHAIGSSAYAVPGTWNVGPSRFVVWRNGSVFDLQTLLDPVTGAGWTITGVTAINDLGQIVGSGLHNGQSRAFMLVPSVP
jgi:uncharacterized membrane protein